MARLTPEEINRIRQNAGLDALPIQNQPGLYDHLKEKPRVTEPGFLTKTKSSLSERFGRLRDTFGRTASGEISPVETGIQTTGEVVGGLFDVSFEVLSALTPDSIKDMFGRAGQAFAETEAGKQAIQALQSGQERYQQFAEQNPRAARNVEALANLASLFPATGASKAGAKGVQTAGRAVREGVGDALTQTRQVAGDVTEGLQKSGITQTLAETAERVPRAVERVRERGQEAAQRAEKIRQSSPVFQQAIKSNLDDRLITKIGNRVQEGDNFALNAYRKMVDIAKKPDGQRPEIVAGEAAAAQYAVIEGQRQAVGKRIGEVAKELSKTQKIDITPTLAKIQSILKKEGATFDDKGGIDLRGFDLIPEERSKVNLLYELATEIGTELTPSQIYAKDRLFSKLQRQSRFEGLGNIVVETAEGKKNVFQLFRDLFNEQLDSISPEIRGLNADYRTLRTFVDDIENSIVKSGRFETAKGVDPAQYAQTSLRRILSDAQSATDYREIVRRMYGVSSELGYRGAKADDLIEFATMLRDVYPKIVPQTSATNLFSTRLADLAGKVFDFGKPELKDQQKALEKLIQESAK